MMSKILECYFHHRLGHSATATRINNEKEKCNESDTQPQEDKQVVTQSDHLRISLKL
jgi:hypothetical protein